MMKLGYQRGVGLVEVLVSLLLLAIGIVGFALLQMKALDASIEASKRIQAMSIAKDIAERIRANQDGLTKNIESQQLDAQGNKETYKAYIKAFEGNESLSSYTYSKCFGSQAACGTEDFAKEDATKRELFLKSGRGRELIKSLIEFKFKFLSKKFCGKCFISSFLANKLSIFSV